MSRAGGAGSADLQHVRLAIEPLEEYTDAEDSLRNLLENGTPVGAQPRAPVPNAITVWV
jgi:hypothetical protein